MKKKNSQSKVIIQLEPAKVLKIEKNGRYLVIFSKKDSGVPGDMTQFNEALKGLFAPEAKVIAVFADDVNSVKIAELIGGENG